MYFTLFCAGTEALDIRRAEQVFAAAQQTMEDMYLSAKNIKM